MRGRVRLILVAAALGIVTGVAAALVVPDVIGENPGVGVGAEPEPVDDPLGLGIPLENLDCGGQAILILKSGDNFSALSSPVTNHSDLDLKYLRPEDSCDTLWIDPRYDTPGYVLYAGPFDSLAQPCEMRLSPTHKRHMVLRVVEDVRMFDKCLCVAPRATFPTLEPGMEQTATSAIYTWQMQNLLARMDIERQKEEDPDPPSRYFTKHDMTSEYDETTVQRIMDLQEGADPPADGVVDEGTWKALTDLGCDYFNF